MPYPYYEKLAKLSEHMRDGNYGLWYNKLIPVKDFEGCKPSDERGNENEVVSYYYRRYDVFRKNLVNRLLEKKLRDQKAFCSSFSARYETLSFKARLVTPLITGIGESHPHEVSLVFDHNMGIPYIPASSVKGIVRFAHTLRLVENIPASEIVSKDGTEEYFDDEKEWTEIPSMFGTQDKRGLVIFLDAYPENVPKLHLDIMNPHYGEYYSKEDQPPGDYLDPKPIKFLAVEPGTVFVFRALVDNERQDLVNKVKMAFTRALTEEGVGAKTSVGYGLFEYLDESDLGESCVAPGATMSDGLTQIDDKQNKLTAFSKIIEKTPNLAAEIDSLLQRINTQHEIETRREMCRILVSQAMKFPKKRKFTKALKNRKAWAKKLKALCDELGINVPE